MGPVVLDDLTDEQLQAFVTKQSVNSAALELNVPRSTLQGVLRRRGIALTPPTPKKPRTAAVRLTRAALHQALEPPNTCKVKALLDALDDESREVVEEALGYPRQDLPARRLAEFLADNGVPKDLIPGVDAINNHRTGTRPCRCRG